MGLAAVVGASVLAGGCAAAGADRSGTSTGPTELVLANNDGDLTGAPAVVRFVEQVEELSGGRLTVRVESDYGGEDRVIEDVAAGEADLGWSGTRAFDLAHDETLDGLGDEARGWLADAAADAVVWSVDHADDAEVGHIETACQGQTRVATATDDQLAQLRAATEPVYEALRADDALADTLARIEELVAGVPEDEPAPLPDGCAYTPGDEDRLPPPPTPGAEPGQTGDLPDGVYRYALSVDELQEAGFSRPDAQFNAGVLTWTLAEGEWTYEQEPEVPDAVPFTTCGGAYDVQEATVTFSTGTEVTGGECAPPSWTARFAIDGESVVWTDVSIDDFSLIFAPEPWLRIG